MRTKRAFWNISTALIYQLVSILSGLIVPRMILEYYGSELNGIVSSAIQFMSAIGILTIGLTGAARVVLYKSLAENDTDTTNNLMNATTRYMNKVALVLLIYNIVLAIVFPYLANTDVPTFTVVLLVLSVGAGKFIEQLLGIPYRILLQADQKNYIENILITIGCILYTIFSVIMIQNNYSIMSVKLMSAAVSFIMMLGIYIYSKKHYQLKKVKNYNRNILAQRKDAALHSIANMIHQNSDLIILTLFEDIKIVSVYTVYYFVVGQIKKILESITGGLEAVFGNIWAKKEYDNIKDWFRFYEWFIYSFVVVVFSCTMVLILPFVRLYTEKVTDINYVRPVLAYLIVAAESVYCIRQPYVTLVFAAGRYKETKKIAVVEALVNVIVSFMFIWRLGILGVIIGTLCANLIRTVYYVYYTSNELIHRSVLIVVYRVAWAAATLIVAIFTGIQATRLIGDITSWASWLVAGGVNFLISVGVTIVSGLIFYKKDVLSFGQVIKVMLRR